MQTKGKMAKRVGERQDREVVRQNPEGSWGGKKYRK